MQPSHSKIPNILFTILWYWFFILDFYSSRVLEALLKASLTWSQRWLDVAKAAKVWEKEVPRDIARFCETTFKVLPNLQSGAWLVGEVLRGSPVSSTRRHGAFSRSSWRTSFVTLLPTPNTPRGKQSQPWTWFTHLNAKVAPSTALAANSAPYPPLPSIKQSALFRAIKIFIRLNKLHCHVLNKQYILCHNNQFRFVKYKMLT